VKFARTGRNMLKIAFTSRNYGTGTIGESFHVHLINLPKSCAVSLFKHANLTKLEQSAGVKAADKGAVSELRMAMLRSWLPLLCRDSNGTDAPVLSSRERSEMVGVLEELIGKLSWEQEEEILTLWLHHFAARKPTGPT
jgi:hypothetical protein